MSTARPHRDGAGKTLAEYPRPSVAVDTALLTVPPDAVAVHVLLVRRTGTHQPGAWSLPGTFLHPGETLNQAVLRCLRDKAGVLGVAPRPLHVFDDPHRDDRGWVLSVAHTDVVPWTGPTAAQSEDVQVVPVDQAPDLPFDHDAILTMAVTALRDRYRHRPDPDRLLPSPFTLHELRLLHQAVHGRALSKDTFRRHMQPHLWVVSGHREGVVGKPAQLYRHPSRPKSQERLYSTLPGT